VAVTPAQDGDVNAAEAAKVATGAARAMMATQLGQGLTLVHYHARRKRFRFDRGCIQGVFGRCLGGVGEYDGVFRVNLCWKRLRLS
jgi:hypothetical protein